MSSTPTRQLKRVVVTGLGLVTPLGVGVNHNWAGLQSGKCGIRLIEDQKFAQLPCRLAAYVPEGSAPVQFNWDVHFGASKRRQMSRGIGFSVVAAEQAWVDSGRVLPMKDDDREMRPNMGVCFGQGMVDLDDVHNTGLFVDDGKHKKVSPYFVPRILTNMAAGAISIRFGLLGPNHAVSTACTTGAHAVGDAFNMIRLGMADVMLCGGADACISPISLAGFARCRALSTMHHDHPQQASRPFDSKRDGFVMGEGAGCITLESLDHFIERSKRGESGRIYAEVLGYGLSGDAHHVTAPETSGRGARLCIKRALTDANLKPTDVEYVNAHGTSTPLGDRIEAAAVHSVFGHRLFISSTKGNTGHLLGAAGAVESIFTIMTVNSGWMPPTLNLENLDVIDENDVKTMKNLKFIRVPNGVNWERPDATRRIALSNSFGFGGTNASLIFGEFRN